MFTPHSNESKVVDDDDYDDDDDENNTSVLLLYSIHLDYYIGLMDPDGILISFRPVWLQLLLCH